MRHNIFLKNKRKEYLDKMEELKASIDELQQRINHIDEMLAEAPDSKTAQAEQDGTRGGGPISIKDVAIRLLKGEPTNVLTVAQMIERAAVEGIQINKTSLQPMLSRNDDDFKILDTRLGKWTLQPKHLPRRNKEDFYIDASVKIEPPQALTPIAVASSGVWPEEDGFDDSDPFVDQ